MSSIFSKIVAGEIPCHKVWEDDHHLAFLDINPVQPGHTLVIPKAEGAYLFDMDEGAYLALWEAVRTVEGKLRRALDAKRVIVDVVGYEVPHVHVHLIPTQQLSDYAVPPRKTMSTEALEELAGRIADTETPTS